MSNEGQIYTGRSINRVSLFFFFLPGLLLQNVKERPVIITHAHTQNFKIVAAKN